MSKERTANDRRILKPGTRPPLRRNRGSRGQSLVEFALVSTTFLFLVFGVIDFSWAMFNLMNVQDAVREAGRYAATGNHQTDSNGSTLSRTASITKVLDYYAAGSGASIQSVTISSVTGGAGSAGGPGDTVTITAYCATPMMTGFVGRFFAKDAKFHFKASSTFKNEPFPTGNTN